MATPAAEWPCTSEGAELAVRMVEALVIPERTILGELHRGVLLDDIAATIDAVGDPSELMTLSASTLTALQHLAARAVELLADALGVSPAEAIERAVDGQPGASG